ncbi:MAG: hypothetical protein ACJAZS_000055 [Alteromonas naphthalenivorans]|jgi:hypothetical protein
MIYKEEQRMKKIQHILLALTILIPTLSNAQSAPGATLYGPGVGLSIAAITEEYQYPFATLQNLTPTAQSGVHLAVISIEYKTSDTAAAAICIDKDNITIDLNNQILWCNSAVTGTPYGIYIKAGVKNVTIKDGTIMGFKNYGIYVEGTLGNEVTNLKIENVNVVSNTNGGVIGTYVHHADLYNLNVRNTTATTHVHGIYFGNSESVSIKDSSALRNITTITNATSYGINLTSCTASSLTNCICNNNKGYLDAVGIYITEAGDDTFSNTITNCTCNNNISSNADGMGIHLYQCDLVHVKDCTMTSNKADLAAKDSYGLRLESANKTTVEGNTAIRNEFGFHDDEALGSQTNLYIQNTAYLNFDKTTPFTKQNYVRTVSTPIDETEASADQLASLASASNKSNISVVIE